MTDTPAAPPNAWSKRDLLAFDLETTGPDPKHARIVTYALIIINPAGQPVAQDVGLVNPGVPIPDEAAEIHGVTTEHATKHGMSPHDALGRIIAALALAALDDVPVCAFNAFYDLTVVAQDAKRHLKPEALTGAMGLLEGVQVIDSRVLDKHVDKRRKGKRQLADVASHYGVTPGDWHTAEADALAAARIAQAIASEHPTLGSMTAAEIHAEQRVWAKAQADSLRSYFRRSKKAEAAASVSSAWPYLGAPV